MNKVLRYIYNIAGKRTGWELVDESTISGGTFSGTLDDITAGTTNKHLTTTLKSNYDTAYSHSQAAHAPSDAQKNSDITKTEIEAKLTGEISSHSHAGSNQPIAWGKYF